MSEKLNKTLSELKIKQKQNVREYEKAIARSQLKIKRMKDKIDREMEMKKIERMKEKIANTKVKLSSNITKKVQLGLSPITYLRKKLGTDNE